MLLLYNTFSAGSMDCNLYKQTQVYSSNQYYHMSLPKHFH